MLAATVARHPDREAILYRGRRFSYGAWNARINRLGGALAELGVRPSDRVAQFLHTSEATATLYFACQKLGAIALCCNGTPASFQLANRIVAIQANCQEITERTRSLQVSHVAGV